MGTTNKVNGPQTNIPYAGTLSRVYFAKTTKPEQGWPDRIKLVGQWETDGLGHFWLPYGTIDAFTDAGLVQFAGIEKGEPTWRVVNPQQRLAIVVREGKGNQKITEAFPVDAQGNRVALGAQQRAPPVQSATPTPSAAPVAAAAAAPAVPPAPGAVAPAPGAPAAPPSAPANGGPSPAQLRAQMHKRWGELDERYATSLAIAAFRLREALGDNVPPEVVQAGAATVLIESNRAGLQALPGLAKALRDRVNGKAPKEKPTAKASPEPAPAPVAAGGGDQYEDFDETDDDDLPF